VYDDLEFIYKEAVVSFLRYHFCIFLDCGKPLKSKSGLPISGPRCVTLGSVCMIAFGCLLNVGSSRPI